MDKDQMLEIIHDHIDSIKNLVEEIKKISSDKKIKPLEKVKVLAEKQDNLMALCYTFNWNETDKVLTNYMLAFRGFIPWSK